MSTAAIPDIQTAITGAITEPLTLGNAPVGALIPQPHGGALRNGGPGSTGRPPNEFRARMQALASSDEVETGLKAMIAAPASPLFLGAVKHVTEHGYGKPTEKHELSGDAKVTVNVVYSHE